MYQLVQILGQAAQWLMRDPRRMQIALALVNGTKRYYRSLSPEQKAKVDRVIRWGGQMLLKHALPEVLGEVSQHVMAAVSNPQVAEFAKGVVTRGASIGIEKALEEAN
jgi:hypothetical protein